MLSGNLELFALEDVLRFVSRSGATGAVNIYRPSEGGRILLVDGEVVGASVDTFEAADHDDVVEAGLRLLEGGAGDFALDIETVDGPVREPVEEFLSAVKRRRGEWRKIVAAVGSVDDPLRLDAHLPADLTEITLSPLEWHLAVIADGHRSLRDLSHELGTSPFAAAQALLAMANAGLLILPGAGPVDVHDVDEEEPEGEPEHVEPLAEEDAELDDQDETEEATGDEEPVSGIVDQEDLDPADLLRELGGRQSSPPRARRLTEAAREEQRLRLRSR